MQWPCFLVTWQWVQVTHLSINTKGHPARVISKVRYTAWWQCGFTFHRGGRQSDLTHWQWKMAAIKEGSWELESFPIDLGENLNQVCEIKFSKEKNYDSGLIFSWEWHYTSVVDLYEKKIHSFILDNWRHSECRDTNM